MRLCESPEFRDAIVTAKDYFNRPGLTEQFIEKDYYVTEALRITALSSNMQYVISSERGERGAGSGEILYLIKVESAVLLPVGRIILFLKVVPVYPKDGT
jgi:hypothetical protein